MRTELGKFNGLRKEFSGTFVRYGTKSGWKGRSVRTILLTDIKLVATDKIVADHIWITEGKQIAKLGFEEGDIILFKARCTEYWKGYKGHDEYNEHPIEKDFRLSFPTDFRVRKNVKDTL